MGKLDHPLAPYYATMVERWHTNPDVRNTGDTLASHGGRMVVLALMVFGERLSQQLLIECATHDLGEYVTGDIPYGAPNKEDKEGLEEEARVAMGIYHDLTVCNGDGLKLKLLDNLDAVLWALHHNPELHAREDWIDQRLGVQQMALVLGVADKVQPLLDSV